MKQRRHNNWIEEAAEQARRMLGGTVCCSETGFVYIVHSPQFPRLVKIGKTSCIVSRMKSLQSGSPVQLQLIALGRGSRYEKLFHFWFDGSRHHGEWFTASTVYKWLGKWRGDNHCLCCEFEMRK